MTMQEVRRNYNRPVIYSHEGCDAEYIFKGLIERRSEKTGELVYIAELKDIRHMNSIVYAELKNIHKIGEIGK